MYDLQVQPLDKAKDKAKDVALLILIHGWVSRTDCPTSIQEVAGSCLGSGNIFCRDLVMKTFLWPFSPYR